MPPQKKKRDFTPDPGHLPPSIPGFSTPKVSPKFHRNPGAFQVTLPIFFKAPAKSFCERIPSMMLREKCERPKFRKCMKVFIQLLRKPPKKRFPNNSFWLRGSRRSTVEKRSPKNAGDQNQWCPQVKNPDGHN